MNYTFEDYEGLLLARLSSLQAPAGVVKDLRGFAGDIVITETGLLLVLLNRYPAVLVEITEAAYQPGPNPFYTQTVTATLHVCSRSLRRQEEARGGEAGAYALLDLVRRNLLGKQLAVDLLPLLLVSEGKVGVGLTEANEHVVIYQAKYQFINPRIQEV